MEWRDALFRELDIIYHSEEWKRYVRPRMTYRQLIHVGAIRLAADGPPPPQSPPLTNPLSRAIYNERCRLTISVNAAKEEFCGEILRLVEINHVRALLIPRVQRALSNARRTTTNVKQQPAAMHVKCRSRDPAGFAVRWICRSMGVDCTVSDANEFQLQAGAAAPYRYWGVVGALLQLPPFLRAEEVYWTHGDKKCEFRMGLDCAVGVADTMCVVDAMFRMPLLHGAPKSEASWCGALFDGLKVCNAFVSRGGYVCGPTPTLSDVFLASCTDALIGVAGEAFLRSHPKILTHFNRCRQEIQGFPPCLPAARL